MNDTSTKTRVTLAALCALLVALPFLCVTFPPITDLPQHIAQIRLLHEALADPGGVYVVRWTMPYVLVYGVFEACWELFSPVLSGRMAAMAIAVLWALVPHAVAARRGRSAASATLASVLAFNPTLYWGFVSFQFGWVAFGLWLVVVGGSGKKDTQEPVWRIVVGTLVAGAVLYLSHALWFVAGCVLLVVVTLVAWPGWRTTLARAAGIVPVGVVAAVWFVGFRHSVMAMPTFWGASVFERLTTSWFSDSAAGGLQGAQTTIVVSLLLLWIGVSVYLNRNQLRTTVDPVLLVTGLLLVVLAFALPYKYFNTVQFAERWVPSALVLLVLALPAPQYGERSPLVRLGAVALVATVSISAALSWSAFERAELSGLETSLAALPERPRVLGLSFVQESDYVTGAPFIQTFAYAQAAKGGELNFSFAQFPHMAVTYRTPRYAPWTPGLEWMPGNVRPSDLAAFDYVIVNGTPDIHTSFDERMPVEPMTEGGRWRLYRVAH